MGLLNRIWDIWTSSAEQELYTMIDQFKIDYYFEEEFQHVLYLIEDAIVEGDYLQAEELFREYAPPSMSYEDALLFFKLLNESHYG